MARTARACEEAIIELAAERPVSQVSVADLAARAGVTRATFYNHYANPLALLIEVLLADLGRAHLQEEMRRVEGDRSPPEMLRLSIVDVADHIERFKGVYMLAVGDPAEGGSTRRSCATSVSTPCPSSNSAAIPTCPLRTEGLSLSSSRMASPEP